MLKSSFSLRAFLSVVLLLVVVILFILLILNFKDAFSRTGGGIFVCIISAFLAIVLFQDIRKNTPVISIKRNEKNVEDNEVTVSKCFGLCKDVSYKIKDFDGFNTSSAVSKGIVYNYIILINDGKKVAKICDAYYSNFRDISDFIKTHLIDLGNIKTNAISELVDTFKK